MKLSVPQFILATTLLATTSLLGAESTPRPAKPEGLEVLISGNTEDVTPEKLEGPMAILMGGGSEVDTVFQQHAFPTLNGGDLVVLRQGRIGGYNSYFYDEVVGSAPRPDSVETIQLDTVEQANSDYVVWALENAEMVWFAGGDQSAYLQAWRGTRAQEAIQKVWDKGGVVGGTSAGLAILGEYIYDPGAEEATISEDTFADPYNKGVTISDRFINIPWLEDVITDSHFRNRDRMGRSLGFMAVLREENRTPLIRAICVSEESAITIYPNGMGTVNAAGEVYILQENADTQRTQVNPGEPLIYGPVDRIHLVEGDQFNFNTWSALKSKLPLSVNGTNPETPILPANYYEGSDPETTSETAGN